MGTRRIQNRPPADLNLEQKIAFGLLLFLGVGGVVFGVRSFGANIYRPIQEQFAKMYTGEDVVNPNAKDTAEREAQKTKDSDSDGLSDYDELYVYNTSPYLADSDSDGTDDKTEVFAGEDPNCPKGKDCVGGGETVATDENGAQQLLTGTPGNEGVIQSGQVNLRTSEDVKNFFQSATVAQIRTALLQAGVSQAEIDTMTDEDLQTLFQQAVSKAADAGQFDSLTTGGTQSGSEQP